MSAERDNRHPRPGAKPPAPSSLIELYLATVRGLPVSEQPTLRLGEDFLPIGSGVCADGAASNDYVASGRLDRVLRRVAKLAGVDRVDVARALWDWQRSPVRAAIKQLPRPASA